MIEFVQTGETAENEVGGQLQDHSGRAYSYTLTTDRHSHDWEVFYDDRRIGYAWCLKNGAEFQIGDLKILNDFTPYRPLWKRLILGRPKPIQLRRRGLGTALLNCIMRHAKECGCESVTGRISTVDTAPFPGLITWYQKHGFEFSAIENCGPIHGQVTLKL